MYNSWNIDLNDSIKAIDKIKYDIIPQLISGELFSLEQNTNDNKIFKYLDTISGIDYLIKDKNGLRSIASRVQFMYGKKLYNSFTTRFQRYTGSETEYEKRLNAIKNTYMYPDFTLQAYFDTKENLNLLSIAIIKTKTLYEEFENNKKVKTRTSDNQFKFLFWDDIENKKAMKIITKP